MAYQSGVGEPRVLTKYRQLPRCIFCGRYDGRVFRGQIVCDDCLEFIRTTF